MGYRTSVGQVKPEGGRRAPWRASYPLDTDGAILGILTLDAGWDYDQIEISPDPDIHFRDPRIEMKQLDQEQKMGLLLAARTAAVAAYCPYSNFRVGASALAEDGSMYTGCNIENDSFGLTMCAERVAVFKAISSGVKKIVALALSFPDAPTGAPDEMKMPCGACRQVMAQFAGSEMVLLIDQLNELSLGDVLPKPFRLSRETCVPMAAPEEPSSRPEP